MQRPPSRQPAEYPGSTERTGEDPGPAGADDPRATADLVTYRDASAWCDRETLDRALSYGRHHDTGGRPSESYWERQELQDIIELIAIETAGGTPS